MRQNTTDDVDDRLMALILARPSITDSELASELGISRQTANRRRNSARVRSLVSNVLNPDPVAIKALLNKSLLVINELMEHPDPRIRLTASSLLVKVALENADKQKPHVAEEEIIYVTTWGDTREPTDRKSDVKLS